MEDDNLVIVCGLGRFGLRVVHYLRQRGARVVVVSDKGTRQDRATQARAMGATLLEGDFRFPEVRAEAGVASAKAVILATSSDIANLETALDVRGENAKVRIVMRLDNDSLASRLHNDFDLDAVLSPAVLAAPSFTRAALEPPAATKERTPNAGPLLPTRLAPRRKRRLRRRRPRAFPALFVTFLAALFGVGVVIFHLSMGISWVDAIYFTATILTTVGFGDYHLKGEPAVIKLFGVVLMFGGVTLIAVLSSFLTNFFLSGAALQLRTEQAARQMKNHIILCGLGSVGFEIAEDILARNLQVVIVDTTPNDAYAQNLSARVPMIVGDATQPDVLRKAGFDRARAVIVALSNDALNLEIGLIAQSLLEESRPSRPLRIVLRCFDPDLARRIHARSDYYTLLSSAELAAPLFVEHALWDGEKAA